MNCDSWSGYQAFLVLGLMRNNEGRRTTARTPRRTLRTRSVRRDDSVRTSPELIWMTAARDATKRILSGRSPRKALARYATTLTRDAWQHASRDRTIYETANAEHSLFFDLSMHEASRSNNHHD